jgi:hypothetical protein
VHRKCGSCGPQRPTSSALTWGAQPHGDRRPAGEPVGERRQRGRRRPSAATAIQSCRVERRLRRRGPRHLPAHRATSHSAARRDRARARGRARPNPDLHRAARRAPGAPRSSIASARLLARTFVEVRRARRIIGRVRRGRAARRSRTRPRPGTHRSRRRSCPIGTLGCGDRAERSRASRPRAQPALSRTHMRNTTSVSRTSRAVFESGPGRPAAPKAPYEL